MQSNIEKEKVIIIDFGSQLTKLIARRIRELGYIPRLSHRKILIKSRTLKILKELYFLAVHQPLQRLNLKPCETKYS